MKFTISGNGPLSAIGKRLELEGDEEVSNGGGLLICSEGIRGTGSTTQRAVLGEWELPVSVLEAIGIKPSKRSMDFFVTKWFSSKSDWSPQTMLGVPIKHLLPEMLGAQCPAGCSLRYVHNGPLVDVFMEHPCLGEVLREMSYNGFVSIGLALGIEFSICSIQTGVPFYGVFPLLEGSSGRLAEFLSGDTPRFRESWTTGLVLSTAGWPFVGCDNRLFVKPKAAGWEKHFWSWTLNVFGESMFSDDRLLGVATGWSPTLHESIRRCKLTLGNLDVPGKQYNPAPGEEITFLYHRIVGRSLVDPG